MILILIWLKFIKHRTLLKDSIQLTFRLQKVPTFIENGLVLSGPECRKVRAAVANQQTSVTLKRTTLDSFKWYLLWLILEKSLQYGRPLIVILISMITLPLCRTLNLFYGKLLLYSYCPIETFHLRQVMEK